MRRSHLTLHRERVIPMQPQLAEILSEYLGGSNTPSGPLLFSQPRTWRPTQRGGLAQRPG
jgi:hypothetical protein